MPETWSLTCLIVQLNWTKKKEAEKHFDLSMKTFKTISTIISKHRDASDINAVTFFSYGQQSLHIEWVFNCSSQINQGLKYQVPITQTRNSLQLFLKPFLSAGKCARVHFLVSKIDFSKWHNPIATNNTAVPHIVPQYPF